jgi:hypothetical protein
MSISSLIPFLYVFIIGNTTLGVSADFQQEYFGVSGAVSGAKVDDKISTLLEASVSVGMDGFTLGGGAKFTPNDNKFSATDVGIQYADSDFQFYAVTEKSGKALNAGYFHKVNSKYELGVKVNYVLPVAADEENKVAEVAGKRTISLVNQYKIDADQSVKVAADTTGKVLFGYQKTLADPKVKVNFASVYNVKGDAKFVAQDFGLKFTFGDY